MKGRVPTPRGTPAASVEPVVGEADTALVPRLVSLGLPFDVSAAGQGRNTVVEILRGTAVEPLREAAVLVCSELITNSVLHGSPPVRLDLAVESASPPCLQITVTDGGTAARPPRPQAATEDADESGRGLLIVTALTATGSLSVGPDTTSACFRLTTEPPGHSPLRGGAR